MCALTNWANGLVRELLPSSVDGLDDLWHPLAEAPQAVCASRLQTPNGLLMLRYPLGQRGGLPSAERSGMRGDTVT